MWEMSEERGENGVIPKKGKTLESRVQEQNNVEWVLTTEGVNTWDRMNIEHPTQGRHKVEAQLMAARSISTKRAQK